MYSNISSLKSTLSKLRLPQIFRLTKLNTKIVLVDCDDFRVCHRLKLSVLLLCTVGCKILNNECFIYVLYEHLSERLKFVLMILRKDTHSCCKLHLLTFKLHLDRCGMEKFIRLTKCLVFIELKKSNWRSLRKIPISGGVGLDLSVWVVSKIIKTSDKTRKEPQLKQNVYRN